jgi:3-hydroxyisobutyrate dehydrogenase-like beta-hydroxyacid dehydrogenase
MAKRQYDPPMGTARTLEHYFGLIGDFANEVGVATPMLDRAKELYMQAIERGLGERDVASVIEIVEAWPRGTRSS